MPTLGLWSPLHRSGLPHGFAVADPVVWGAPGSAEPEACCPARFQKDVHVLARALPPQDLLAKFEALFVDVLAEESLVSRTPVGAFEVLGGGVRDVLH